MSMQIPGRFSSAPPAFCAGLILLLLPAILFAQGIVWDPANSTYDGTGFTVMQTGVGATSFGFPTPSNPAGGGVTASGVYAFGFATAIPSASGLTAAQTDLAASPLVAGTELVLRFNKGESDHISFIAMVADASDLSNTGFKLISTTEFEIRAKIVNPVLSETNNPDILDAAFGMIIYTTSTPDEAFNFKGTIFVTDMHWLDMEPPDFSELAQGSDDVQGMAAGIAAKGISALDLDGAANFNAFMPEAFFQFGRDNGVEVTGADCLGYRAFVELTGSEDGFFKLNDPTDEPFSDSNFDIDGDGQPDDMWRFRITNSTWSRQVLSFGRASTEQTLTGDFDDDGEVGFRDFVQFVSKYNSKEGDEKYESKYDLNPDGEINFSDFVTFVKNYGSKK